MTIIVIIVCVLLGIKWLFKSKHSPLLNFGPGSVGESARVLANNYIFFTKPSNSNLPTDISTPNFILFELMYNFRQSLNNTLSTQGDLLQQMEFEEFHSQYPSLEREKDDLLIFILKILYYEDLKWRKNIHNISDEMKKTILNVIYDSVVKIAPTGVKLNHESFLQAGLSCINQWGQKWGIN
jgi:hypothetical protein